MERDDLEFDGLELYPEFTRDERERLPLPSEDSGDLWEPPRTGMTTNHVVATEEGVPWDPPLEDMRHEGRDEEVESEAAQAVRPRRPRDEALLEIAVDALQRSALPAGDHLQVAVDGGTLIVMGEVESIEIADELAGLLEQIDGVDEVIDLTEVVPR